MSGEDSRVSTRRTEVEHGQELDAARRGWSEAERVGRIKDEFLANLSHELRTPLNAILGWAQLLQPGRWSAGDLAEGVEVIERNARVQVQLIEDLLDMSRIISGKLRLDVQRVDLPAVIEAALESVRPAADAKGDPHAEGAGPAGRARSRATPTGCSRSSGTCCPTR